METCYLVDNNVLNALSRKQVESDFFRNTCRITEDVLWEAREHFGRARLEEQTVKLTTLHLEHLRAVMSTVAADDTRLIDLYKNNGAADPGLIAFVLAATLTDGDTLFSDYWILVTNDTAVSCKATDFDIEVIGIAEFVERCEVHMSSESTTVSSEIGSSVEWKL